MKRRRNEQNLNQGRCALTGKEGVFVDAHILPKALTRPERRGASFIQRSSGKKPIRRWSSWYDANLVIADGEAILERYDTWAIRVLRSQKLVWTGWHGATSLSKENFEPLEGTPIGIRRVSGINTRRLRLFFLSLLWRAAASNLMEFEDVKLPPETLEKLRRMVEEEDALPLDFLPVSLTQISTSGIIHNQGIFQSTKILPGLPGLPQRMSSYYRIYIDGLIAHVHLDGYSASDIRALGDMMLGSDSSCTLPTVTFERSFELENLRWVNAESLD